MTQFKDLMLTLLFQMKTLKSKVKISHLADFQTSQQILFGVPLLPPSRLKVARMLPLAEAEAFGMTSVILQARSQMAILERLLMTFTTNTKMISR